MLTLAFIYASASRHSSPLDTESTSAFLCLVQSTDTDMGSYYIIANSSSGHFSRPISSGYTFHLDSV